MSVKSLLQTALVFAVAFASPDFTYREMYRPQYHYTPEYNWMNDPNGLLYVNGTYHMYYQWNPNGDRWGDISWGHATSTDLTHWEQQPMAIEYDYDFNDNPLAYYFSGSAVLDTNRSSGFCKATQTPIVAIFTISYAADQTAPGNRTIVANQQAQGIAYSCDGGISFTKYAKNPVIYEPPAEYDDQIENFRDPFVFWYAPQSKWVMVVSLPNAHVLMIYESHNLKKWTHLSYFGPVNAQGGQWECPNLFPLAASDSDELKWVVMMGINPGGLYIGSATQYVVGDFDGHTFTADPSSIVFNGTNQVPARAIVIADFEQVTYTAAGWTGTGGLANQSVATGALGGQQAVAGFIGHGLVNTFIDGDSTTGTLTSEPFRISKNYITFLIGGGYNPYIPSLYGTPADNETALLLLIDNQVVRSATGADAEFLTSTSWNVAEYLGRTAQLKIIDMATGGWGHINVDEITMSDSASTSKQANWMDFGPDFYAAASYNGLANNERVAIGWMNNWQYAADIPTHPWRSAMAYPRTLALATINGKVNQLIQTPVTGLLSLEQNGPAFSKSFTTNVNGSTNLGALTGKTMDLNLTFSTTGTTAHQFGVSVLRQGPADQPVETTIIGYDFLAQQMYVDRTNSSAWVANSFSGVYAAPLVADNGIVTLRILVDWSSVEVFGNKGEAVITAQIFPSNAAKHVSVWSNGGSTEKVTVRAHGVASAWA